MKYRAVATCGFGLESVLSFELRRLGVENIEVRDGRAFFDADAADIARANVWLRTAERVLIVLSEYHAETFDELFDGARDIRWNEYLAVNDQFPVKGYSMNSKLTSVPACQSVMKKAVVESLKARLGVQFLPERGDEQRIQFALVKDECTVMLDTSGDGLHKRGYRPLMNEAPIKETLAAGIADFARVRADSAVRDPFCGSGTLVIEAAQKAMELAPGLRRRFAFENFSFFDKGLLADVREEAKSKLKTDCGFRGVGTDIDPAAVELARANARRAGVGDICSFEVADATKARFEENDIILGNPPYGERLMDPQQVALLYRGFCNNISQQSYKGLYVITNYPDFEHDMGKRASRRRKLYNGMLPCQLYMYF